MSSTRTPDAFATISEDCAYCGHETSHEVAIEMRTESQQRENAEFSREPYRVSECTVCGTETTTRMNNA